MTTNKQAEETLIGRFSLPYIQRAMKVYIKNYGDNNVNMEVVIEIIVRLKFKDESKITTKAFKHVFVDKLKWKCSEFSTREHGDCLYACLATEIDGKDNLKSSKKRIVGETYEYMQQNKQYLKKMYELYDKKGTHITFHKLLAKRKNKQIFDGKFVDIVAVSELYNVAIIVLEYDMHSKSIIPVFARFIDEAYIPTILLTIIKPKYCIVHDMNDIIHSISPSTNLIENYLNNAAVLKTNEIIVTCVCKYWIKTNNIQYIPNDICCLLVKLMPQLNIRPIGKICGIHLDCQKLRNKREIIDLQMAQLMQMKAPPKVSQLIPVEIPPKVAKLDPPFVAHMSIDEMHKLQIHNKIDHRDDTGRFVYATITNKQGTCLKIHYDGWNYKWDIWSDYSLEIYRFASAGSISKRKAHRFKQLKVGDYIDINPTLKYSKWVSGKITRLDENSGQVQIVDEDVISEKNNLYWVHLDNNNEVAEFHTKACQTRPPQIMTTWEKKLKYYNKCGRRIYAVFGYVRCVQSNNKWFCGFSINDIASIILIWYGDNPPMDEMDKFQRIRDKRFPLDPNERIDNRWGVGDWMEVQDKPTTQWITAVVIDVENNWIVVHFDGWSSTYDQKIHVIKHRNILRDLDAGRYGLKDEDTEMKEEFDNAIQQIENLNWKVNEIDGDGNCLYKCFAYEIYGDISKHMFVRNECCEYINNNKEFFMNFIPDFDARMKEKNLEWEWGDHVDITALSELYNVRVHVYEYDKQFDAMYVSFDQGKYENAMDLALILLWRHRRKRYNIIIDPQSACKRPLNNIKCGNDKVSLRELRLKEYEKEYYDENKEHAEEDDNNTNYSQSIAQNNAYEIKNGIMLTKNEFLDVLEMWNLCEPLQLDELKNIFQSLLNKIYKKFEILIKEHPFLIINANKYSLDKFMKQQFKQPSECNENCKRWIDALKQNILNQQYTIDECLNTFNQTITASIWSL